jgi:hypothetical protein
MIGRRRRSACRRRPLIGDGGRQPASSMNNISHTGRALRRAAPLGQAAGREHLGRTARLFATSRTHFGRPSPRPEHKQSATLFRARFLLAAARLSRGPPRRRSDRRRPFWPAGIGKAAANLTSEPFSRREHLTSERAADSAGQRNKARRRRQLRRRRRRGSLLQFNHVTGAEAMAAAAALASQPASQSAGRLLRCSLKQLMYFVIVVGVVVPAPMLARRLLQAALAATHHCGVALRRSYGGQKLDLAQGT